MELLKNAYPFSAEGCNLCASHILHLFILKDCLSPQFPLSGCWEALKGVLFEVEWTTIAICALD